MAKPVQIAVKHGGSDPWIFKLRFQRLVLLFIAMGGSIGIDGTSDFVRANGWAPRVRANEWAWITECLQISPSYISVEQMQPYEQTTQSKRPDDPA